MEWTVANLSLNFWLVAMDVAFWLHSVTGRYTLWLYLWTVGRAGGAVKHDPIYGDGDAPW
jgi:hypothetical protein